MVFVVLLRTKYYELRTNKGGEVNLKKSVRVYTEQSRSGFTLVELLIVIAIIAILAVIVTVVINPIEIMRQGRDSDRMASIASLQQAINITAQEATDSGEEILCYNTAAPCSGNSVDNTRAADGGGWVKVNLTGQKTVTMPTLPTDPTNNGNLKYDYYSDGTNWEINAVLESEKFKDTQLKMANDGGNNPDRYEVGSSLILMP